MKHVISNQNISVLWLPEHETRPNVQLMCMQKSVTTPVTLHILTGHVGAFVQVIKNNLLDKTTSALLNIVVQLKVPECYILRFITFYSQRIQSITIIVLWTNKNVSDQRDFCCIIKHPQNYDSFKQLAYLKGKTFFSSSPKMVRQCILDKPCQREHF